MKRCNSPFRQLKWFKLFILVVKIKIIVQRRSFCVLRKISECGLGKYDDCYMPTYSLTLLLNLFVVSVSDERRCEVVFVADCLFNACSAADLDDYAVFCFSVNSRFTGLLYQC